MASKISAEQTKHANVLLSRFDRLASEIQANHATWGMSFDDAKRVVNALDKVADSVEESYFGKESMERRQVEVLKTAKVIQKDSDEPYMDSFGKPTAPIQTDADEPYMSAYADDQSSAVSGGKSTSGRPLAP